MFSASGNDWLVIPPTCGFNLYVKAASRSPRDHTRRERSRYRVEKPELAPQYLRASQASYVYGLSPTRIFALLTEGKIKSRYLVQPGNKRGIRLEITFAPRGIVRVVWIKALL